MSIYRLSFDIDSSEKLGTIIAALANEGVTFHVSEYGERTSQKTQPKSFRDPNNSRAAKIVFDNTPIGGKLDLAKCRDQLEAAGFAASTLSPTMSRLCQGGWFKRHDDNSLERIR
ncbi:hypothetical protein C4587_00855 [Candidatus Parcubacteria bacterium]|nr:MAG: hypothetical protein C4587_00855 [Candidatus Parcubacteria bacterium]